MISNMDILAALVENEHFRKILQQAITAGISYKTFRKVNLLDEEKGTVEPQDVMLTVTRAQNLAELLVDAVQGIDWNK